MMRQAHNLYLNQLKPSGPVSLVLWTLLGCVSGLMTGCECGPTANHAGATEGTEGTEGAEGSTSSSGGSTDTQETGDETTGGAVEPPAVISLLVTGRFDNPDKNENYIVNISDGVAHPPISLHPDLGDDESVSIARMDPRANMAIYTLSGATDQALTYVDMSQRDDPGPPQEIHRATSLGLSRFLPDGQNALFSARSGPDENESFAYLVPYEDTEFLTPQVVVGPRPGMVHVVAIDDDDLTRAVYLEQSDDQLNNLLLAPLSNPDPDNVVQLTQQEEPGNIISRTTFLASGDVAYTQMVNGDIDIYLLPIVDGVGENPIWLNDEPEEPWHIHDVRFNPTGSSLIYSLIDGAQRKLMYIDLSDLQPSPDVEIASFEVFPAAPQSPFWSSDGRYISYGARDGDTDPMDVYMIAFNDGQPSAPKKVASASYSLGFNADTKFMYYETRPGDGSLDGVYRVELDNFDNVQALAEGYEVNAISLSPTREFLAFSTPSELDPTSEQIYLVDVGDEVPGSPTLAADSIPAGEIQGIAVSRDGTAVAFTLNQGGNVDLYVADTSSPQSTTRVFDGPFTYQFVEDSVDG